MSADRDRPYVHGPVIQKNRTDAGPPSDPNERNASYRQIFLDGRPLPADPQPSWLGYSTARWDGDALVVRRADFAKDCGSMRRAAP